MSTCKEFGSKKKNVSYSYSRHSFCQILYLYVESAILKKNKNKNNHHHHKNLWIGRTDLCWLGESMEDVETMRTEG